MKKFPEIFSEGLKRCIKAKAIFKIKENVTPIFRSKSTFAAEAYITKELERLEQIGVLTKTDYSERASFAVYKKKKKKKKKRKLGFCADFCTGLNDCLPCPEYIFSNYVVTKYSQNWICLKHTQRFLSTKNLQSI